MFALVLDGQQKSSLAAVRSLGRKGIAVVCGAERISGMAIHSKYTARRFTYASPKENPEQFLKDVEAQARTLKEKPVIFTFSDATSLLLQRNHENVRQWAHVVENTREAVEIAADKKETYELAQKLSIPVIPTYTEDTLDAIAFPAVVKNRHSIVWREGKAVSGSAQFVHTQEALRHAVARIKGEVGEEPLVMDFIKGEEYGVEMVCKEGKIISSFAHKRIRSLSPCGGAAVVKETAKENADRALMEQYAKALVKELSWSGPIMVEFKKDEKSGRVLLMEINGRFWGSLPLAVEAGADFPYLAYRLAAGGMVDFVSRPAKLVRTRHFLGDCRWLLSVFFARDPMRPYLYPSRLTALWDFKTEVFKSRGDVFAWDDLLPSIWEYIDIIQKNRIYGN